MVRETDRHFAIPERGQIVKDLSRRRQMVRRILFGRKPNVYRIYFSIEGETVRVLHIRHGARREPESESGA
jgi:plasmid stabilization system protein ParE